VRLFVEAKHFGSVDPDGRNGIDIHEVRIACSPYIRPSMISLVVEFFASGFVVRTSIR
jgi:hypothetical protein